MFGVRTCRTLIIYSICYIVYLFHTCFHPPFLLLKINGFFMNSIFKSLQSSLLQSVFHFIRLKFGKIVHLQSLWYWETLWFQSLGSARDSILWSWFWTFLIQLLPSFNYPSVFQLFCQRVGFPTRINSYQNLCNAR